MMLLMEGFPWIFAHKKINLRQKSFSDAVESFDMKSESEIETSVDSFAISQNIANVKSKSKFNVKRTSKVISSDSAVAIYDLEKASKDNTVIRKSFLVAYKRAAAKNFRIIVLKLEAFSITVRCFVGKLIPKIVKLSRLSKPGTCNGKNILCETGIFFGSEANVNIGNSQEATSERNIIQNVFTISKSVGTENLTVENKVKTSHKASITFLWPVTFLNYDGTFLYETLVHNNEASEDPVIEEYISAPSRPNSPQWIYGSLIGWSTTKNGNVEENVLQNITCGTVLYAVYEKELRQYTARFFDGETLMQESYVYYGQEAVPPDTTKEKYDFIGWIPRSLVITGDTDFYGEWVESPDLIPMETYTFEQKSGNIMDEYFGADGDLLFTVDNVFTKRDAEESRKYYVYWDGEIYICEGREISYGIVLPNGTQDVSFTGICLGNSKIIKHFWLKDRPLIYYDTLSNGEPFIINILKSGSYIYAEDKKTTHTVRVWENIE